MADFQPGDILTLTRHPGLWVVLGLDLNAVPPLRLWRVVADLNRLPPGLTIGDGDMQLVERRSFTPGQLVRYGNAYDGKAEVLSDSGDTVSLRYEATAPAQSRPAAREPGCGEDGISALVALASRPFIRKARG